MGGTFDPVHYGHLILAQQAVDSFGLDKVLFITACVPPHKAGITIADAADRHEMVVLAIRDNPLFEPCDMELRREGPSYTVDTLTQLAEDNPGDRLFMLLGSDEAVSFGSWYRPERIMELATVVAANRPGYDMSETVKRLPEDMGSKLRLLQIPGVDISSSDIRDRVRAGRSIRYLVPPEVADYISIRGLYRTI